MDFNTEDNIKEYLGTELYNKLSSKAKFGVVFLFQHFRYSDILDLVDDLSFEDCQIVDLVCEEFEDYIK